MCGGKGKERWKAFDLCGYSPVHFLTCTTKALHAHFIVLAIPRNRQTLASSGLVPQCYDFDDLEAMGMCVPLFLLHCWN